MNREALASIRAWKSPEWRDAAQDLPHPAGTVLLVDDELNLVLAGLAPEPPAYFTSCIPPMCGCPPTTLDFFRCSGTFTTVQE